MATTAPATVHHTDKRFTIVRAAGNDYPFISTKIARRVAADMNTRGVAEVLDSIPYVGSPSEHDVYGRVL